MQAQRDIERGDGLMRESRFAEARAAYQAAWPASQDLADVQRFWLLMCIANAAVRALEFDEAFEACAAAQRFFARSTDAVAGNPLFHLLAGIAADGLDEREVADDNLARALICGGPAIFTGEAPRYLEHVTALLKPPAETGTWEGYAGCSLAQMNSICAFGARKSFLEALIEARIGAPLPYPLPLDLKQFEGACTDPMDRPAPWGEGRVHFVSRRDTGEDVVKFYADLDALPELVECLRVDYELLDPSLTDIDARELIVHVYFVAFTGDYYRGQVRAFDLGRTSGGARFRQAYPSRRE
ncbi:MAG: hypothetical protein AB7K71_22015 [Polyangiaceae bacterium]